jgi:hypothetical protein
MLNNPHHYHMILRQIGQWLPDERITRQRNMALLVSGLFLSMSIHLSLIVNEWPLPGKTVSLTNRLRRFLTNERVTVEEWYWPVAKQMVATFANKELRLVIDCTKVGFNYRLMTIGLAYRKRTLPLVWSVHKGRKGDVGVKDQIALFKRLRPLIPRSAKVWVYGDSGFQYVPLLRWMRQRGWHFIVRQKGYVKVYRTGDGWRKINNFALSEGQSRYIGWVRLTQKHNAGWFWLILHWKQGEDEPWYLVCDQYGQADLIRRYGVRMWVEEMYGDMKGHGFDLEATHLDDADRISRLFLAICITFVWFISLGSWVVKRGFRHFVDRKDRRDKSYFRLGWDWLKRCQRLNQPLKLLFSPYL